MDVPGVEINNLINAMTDEWLGLLPERELWPPELVLIVDRGGYMVWRHNDDHIVLLSTVEGDDVLVRRGRSRVQARVAVNRTTGKVAYPGLEDDIGEWEAAVMGELQRYLADTEHLRNNSLVGLDMTQARITKGSLRGQEPDQA